MCVYVINITMSRLLKILSWFYKNDDNKNYEMVNLSVFAETYVPHPYLFINVFRTYFYVRSFLLSLFITQVSQGSCPQL